MRHPSGRVSLFNLVLMSALGAGIYALVMFTPFYVDNMDVKEAVSAAHHMARNSENSDAALRREIRQRTSQMGHHWERDQFDNDVLKPGLGLKDENILIERSAVNNSVRIEVNYERPVRLKPTNRYHLLEFSVVKEGIP